MKSYFAINHNPDAKDLKQLAQKTGLTKRVLQVRRAVFFLKSKETIHLRFEVLWILLIFKLFLIIPTFCETSVIP